MTDRTRRLNHENGGYISEKVNDLSPKKTIVVLVIVVGCFAVLWPKVFYPMIVGSSNNRIKPSHIDRTQGCCDLIYEKDVATIKVMSEICNTIIKKDNDSILPTKELLENCQNLVLNTCGIDISAVLQEQVRLGHTTRQILEDIRSLNGSLCLKYNFGVAPWKLGVPHRIAVKMSPHLSIKQERPLHLRSEMVHPAFRERGRAIPQTDFAPTKPASPSFLIPKVVEGRPGPIPGMRPTIGGAGHVVPAKQGGSSVGLIMPIYTIGIVIFFTYTVMKIVFKKHPDVIYPPVNPDPHFRREVFEADRGHYKAKDGVSSKLVVNAMSALLDEVDMELSSPRKTSDVIQEETVANGSLNQEDDQSSVQIVGMVTTASRENGQKWTKSASPVVPTATSHIAETPPQEIFLEGTLPPQSHLLVTDSATEVKKVEAEEDPAVVLAGKMTLSVISLDSLENGTDESSPERKSYNGSSSNMSDQFEKIDLVQLEEQPEIGENTAFAQRINQQELHLETQEIRIPTISQGGTNVIETGTKYMSEEESISLTDDVIGTGIETLQINQEEIPLLQNLDHVVETSLESSIEGSVATVDDVKSVTHTSEVHPGKMLVENLETNVAPMIETVQNRQKELEEISVTNNVAQFEDINTTTSEVNPDKTPVKNVIEASVTAVVEAVQDKQKELEEEIPLLKNVAQIVENVSHTLQENPNKTLVENLVDTSVAAMIETVQDKQKELEEELSQHKTIAEIIESVAHTLEENPDKSLVENIVKTDVAAVTETIQDKQNELEEISVINDVAKVEDVDITTSEVTPDTTTVENVIEASVAAVQDKQKELEEILENVSQVVENVAAHTSEEKPDKPQVENLIDTSVATVIETVQNKQKEVEDEVPLLKNIAQVVESVEHISEENPDKSLIENIIETGVTAAIETVQDKQKKLEEEVPLRKDVSQIVQDEQVDSRILKDATDATDITVETIKPQTKNINASVVYVPNSINQIKTGVADEHEGFVNQMAVSQVDKKFVLDNIDKKDEKERNGEKESTEEAGISVDENTENQHEEIEDEYEYEEYEEDDEENEELEQEIIEYVSDEEEEVEEEEVDDTDEDEKVISHI